MDWNDLSYKIVLIGIAVMVMVSATGIWWHGVVVATPMILIFLIAAMIQRSKVPPEVEGSACGEL